MGLSVPPGGSGLGDPCCSSVGVFVAQVAAPTPSPDTSFMYMIAGLCMLKLYQKRHPDINASAYSAYACLAIVIFFSVLGVVRPQPVQRPPRRRGAHACVHPHPPPPRLPKERSLLLL